MSGRAFRSVIGVLLMLICCCVQSAAQETPKQPATIDHVLEGGRLVVEVLKMLGGRQWKSDDPLHDCRLGLADFCVENHSVAAISVMLRMYGTPESRELVVQSEGLECSLRLPVGVWSYEMRQSGTQAILRKGDILIEACNDLKMSVK